MRLNHHDVFPRGALGVIGFAAALLCSTMSTAVYPQTAATARTLRISAGPLGQALVQFTAQSGVQLLYDPVLARGRSTAGYNGTDNVRFALDALLRGTGLSYTFTDSNTVVIKRAAPVSPPAQPAQSSQLPSASPPPLKTLSTITVTGSLRRENLEHFAGSDTPLTGAYLDQIGANSMQDYLGTVPGVSFAQGTGPGLSNITIRGVGTTTFIDQGQQTTGIYIDGIPLTEAYFNLATPDIDTFDVHRVEVLRGPQGTTFGTGSMGGAVNYIPNKPDLGTFEDRFELGLNRLTGNHSLGHIARAMINFPVGDRFAMRAVVDDNRTPGYIDNIGTGQKNANVSDVLGGRLLATWEINDTTSLHWLTLYQKIKDFDAFHDSSSVEVMKIDTAFPQTFDTSTLINSLKFEHRFQGATLNVMLSEHRKAQHSTSDFTSSLGALLGNLTGPIHYPQAASAKGGTAEVRLTSRSTGPLQWVAGAIYDEANIQYDGRVYAQGAAAAIDTLYGPGLGELLAPNDVFLCNCGDGALRVRGQQSAAYGEVYWNFAPRWKLTLGGRYYDSKVTSTQVNFGLLNFFTTGQPSTYLVGKQKATGFSPKASLSYQVSNNTMIYGLVSTGFRYGGPNANPSGSTSSTPPAFGPDKLTNYELGLRKTNAARTLTTNLTGYFIDWKNVQLRTRTPTGLAYAINAGHAHDYGVEVDLDWQPNRHFEWRSSLAYLRAYLTQPYQQTPTMVAPSGTLLPGSSKWSGSSMITYRFDGEHHPFVTATWSYRSKATVDLFNTGPKLGNYSLFGLRGGFVADGATWTAYIDNIGNSEGLSNVSIVTPTQLDRYYVEPRTVGIMVDFSL